MLENHLRLELNPDQCEQAVLDCWTPLQEFDASAELEYQIFWELTNFLHGNDKKPAQLSQMFTITSGEDCDQAQAIKATEKSAIFHLTLKVTDPEHISVRVNADYDQHREAVSIFSWISATFRNTSISSVSLSQCAVKCMTDPDSTEVEHTAGDSKCILFQPKPLEPAPSSKVCWHALVPGCIIAQGFHINDRLDGTGLEISALDLIVVSEALSFVQYDGGLIAHGLSLVLIPMKVLSRDRAIQWHFEDKTMQSQLSLASIPQILKLHKIEDWYRETVLENLLRSRCFLGWVERANVMIGTSGYQSAFRLSGAETSPSSGLLVSHDLSRLSKRTTLLQTTIAISQKKGVWEIMRTGKEHFVFLYDNGDKIAWCIPRITFALQMAHSIVITGGYRLLSKKGYPVADESPYFASVTPDSVEAALIAVKKCLRLKVLKGSGDDEETGGEDFEEFIKKSWHVLSEIHIGLRNADEGFMSVGDMAPGYIHGVELVDAINLDERPQIKRVRVDQPWAHLTDQERIVILSRDFKPPIVPASADICSSWSSVPPQRNFLVAMGFAANSFWEKSSNGLGRSVEWDVGKSLICCHGDPKSSSVSQTHQV